MCTFFASCLQDWIPAVRSSCIYSAQLHLVFQDKLMSLILSLLLHRTTGCNRPAASRKWLFELVALRTSKSTNSVDHQRSYEVASFVQSSVAIVFLQDHLGNI